VHILYNNRVSFKGEIGVDYGGVKREFFTIAIKEIIAKTDLLGTCANGHMVWFTGNRLLLARETAAAQGSTREAREREEGVHKQARLTTASAAVHSSVKDASAPSANSSRKEKYHDLTQARPLAYYLGLLVGLATYNEVHVDVPLPSCIYKTIKGEEVNKL
jgi:hypothetical protein